MKERLNKLGESGVTAIDFFVNKQPHALILLAVAVASGILAVAKKDGTFAALFAVNVGAGVIMARDEIRRVKGNKK